MKIPKPIIRLGITVLISGYVVTMLTLFVWAVKAVFSTVAGS